MARRVCIFVAIGCTVGASASLDPNATLPRPTAGFASLRGARAKVGNSEHASKSTSDVPRYAANCLKDIVLDDADQNLGSWESIVECTEWAVDNYYNSWCDDIEIDDWTKHFYCGNSDEPTYYALIDEDGVDHGDSIKCYVEQGQRVIEFPKGRFELNEQVWVPPQTTVTGVANPNADRRDQFAGGQQTYFVAYDGLNEDNYYDPYCYPKKNDDPMIAKRQRKGFNMHSNTQLSNVIILGADTARPEENGNLCGGGAIETPGCISQYGGNMDQIPLERDEGEVPPSLPVDQSTGLGRVGPGCYDYKTFEAFGDRWVTGGYKIFQATENVAISNVRLNDIDLRDEQKTSDPRDWPASQVGLLFAPMVDSKNQYLNNIRVDNLVVITSVADGINLHGSMYGVTISNSYVANTGDDALAIWAGPADIKDVKFEQIDVVNPGVRQQGYDYLFGSCFSIFGVHSVEIDGLTCYDRACPTASEASCANAMCTDSANGHLVVVREPTYNGFDGHYYYEGGPECDDCGPAKITLTNIAWKYMDSDDDVDSSDPIGYLDLSNDNTCDTSGAWQPVDGFTRSMVSGGNRQYWGDQPQLPTVSVDGGSFVDLDLQ